MQTEGGQHPWGGGFVRGTEGRCKGRNWLVPGKEAAVRWLAGEKR